MAEILDPSSCSFAPPTLQQTVSLAGNLQEQITDLASRIRILQNAFNTTNDSLSGVRIEVTRTAAIVNANASSQNEVLASLETFKKDFSRSTIVLHRLRASQDATKEDVSKLKEACSGLVAEVSGLSGKKDNFDDVMKELKETIRTSNIEIDAEQDEKIQRLQLSVEKLFKDQEQSRNMTRETAESLSSVVNDVHVLKDNVSRTSTLTHVLNSRTTEQGASLKVCRERMQQAGATLKMLKDMADSNNASIRDYEGGALEHKARIDGLERLMEDSRDCLQTAQLRIEREAAGLKNVREGLDRAQGHISQFSESQEATAATIRTMQMRLHETHSKINEILEGIKDTNALVLPNVLQTGVGKDMNPSLLTKVSAYEKSIRGQNGRLGSKTQRSPWAPDKSMDKSVDKSIEKSVMLDRISVENPSNASYT